MHINDIPSSAKLPSIIRRFEDKYIPEPMSGCWLWFAAATELNSGRMTVGNRTEVASRISFVLHKGTIPDGIYVLHRCDNLACVNPDHLFLGTSLENTRDMIRKGRGAAKRYLSEKEIAELPLLIKSAGSYAEAARRIGVSAPALFRRIAKDKLTIAADTASTNEGGENVEGNAAGASAAGADVEPGSTGTLW